MLRRRMAAGELPWRDLAEHFCLFDLSCLARLYAVERPRLGAVLIRRKRSATPKLERDVLHKKLREDRPMRQRTEPLNPALTFSLEGLVLGAGTVLLEMDGRRRPQRLQGQELRLLALLSAFHGKPTAPSALQNIGRAAKAWSEGDDCLAYVHLAQAGLSPPQDFRLAAHRLEMAQSAVKHGASPRAVFKALHFDARYIDAVEKAYNPAEPRVPAGSGRTSGEWTDGASTVEDDTASETTAGGASHGSSLLVLPASSFLGELSAAQAVDLGAFAARLVNPAGAAVAAFGLLFIPSPNNIRVEGEVSEIPGLRYSWDRDETQLHLTYDDPDRGQRTFSAHWTMMFFATRTEGQLVACYPGAPSLLMQLRYLPIWSMKTSRGSVRPP